jgi:type I restriction enzyme S subunit
MSIQDLLSSSDSKNLEFKEAMPTRLRIILLINSIMVALNGQGKTKGTVAILKIESSCNQSLAAFICDEKKLHFNYFFHYFESKYKELRRLVGGSLRDGPSLGYLKSIDSPLPPIFEQRTIAAFLDHETGCNDILTTKVRESTSKLREYRTALISVTVTGKIDVREDLVS